MIVTEGSFREMQRELGTTFNLKRAKDMKVINMMKDGTARYEHVQKAANSIMVEFPFMVGFFKKVFQHSVRKAQDGGDQKEIISQNGLPLATIIHKADPDLK
jgi:hypothetical protein